jgi:curved DNA-binding protein CbpA
MPAQRFRGNPYQVLDVPPNATSSQIKRRWRELAREHHPDRAAGDTEEAGRLTARMARINAAYDLLRDPVRRAHFDASADGRRARQGRPGGPTVEFDEETPEDGPFGPPPPPYTAPVTARFDMSSSFRPRNTTLGAERTYLRGHPPRSRRSSGAENDLRASTPTGPVQTHRGARPQPLPTLREARETTLQFGRYHGYTLGEVEMLEPAYLDWVARTITRDRELVTKARVILADLDERGRNRKNGEAEKSRPAAPGFEDRAAAG